MQRRDWKVAGAAALLAGLTVGGFSLASQPRSDRVVEGIELRGTPGSGQSPASIGAPTPFPTATAAPSGSGDLDSATASLGSPQVVRPTVVAVTPSPVRTLPPLTDSVDSADGESVDSADSPD